MEQASRRHRCRSRCVPASQSPEPELCVQCITLVHRQLCACVCGAPMARLMDHNCTLNYAHRELSIWLWERKPLRSLST
eukprot:6194566-Pleurochrysis_carterae.AAC.3